MLVKLFDPTRDDRHPHTSPNQNRHNPKKKSPSVQNKSGPLASSFRASVTAVCIRSDMEAIRYRRRDHSVKIWLSPKMFGANAASAGWLAGCRAVLDDANDAANAVARARPGGTFAAVKSYF